MVVDSWLRSLKIFVVSAGVVLVLGTAALVFLLVQRGAPSRDAPSTAPGAPPASAPRALSVSGELPLPAGAAIVDLATEGGEIVLLLRTPAGEDYLAVVDAATGVRRLLLRIVPERR
ncbi:MAG: hypothetical protein RMK73_09905 [Geminicoccaceae bacterium]|nr:hypothetical protein [Geminicoccaceae bacterium]